jgi:hypothetical protein
MNRGASFAAREVTQASTFWRMGAAVLALAAGTALGCGGGSDDDSQPGAGTAGKGGATSGGGTGGEATGGSGGSTGGSGGTTSGSGGKSGSSGKGGGSGTGAGLGKGAAADLANKLGRNPNFLFGLGADLADDHNQDGAYTLGVTLDMHYAYLVGLPGKGGWPDWNSNGTFVNILADTADAHGVTPMYTLYAMAASGEDNTSALADTSYMGPYWQGAKLLFQRLGDFGKPAIVHLEPDFWAYFQQNSGGDPSTIHVAIAGLADDCVDQPEDLNGLGHCLLKLARMYAPLTAVGFHASEWAGAPADTVSFLTAVGAADADFVAIDMLDRDAGCFEAHTDSGCQRNDGPWYWDESNQTSPNFHDFLGFSRQISDGLGKPLIWWQVPLGVPSNTPGGKSGHYRDNRVHYIFDHVSEFIDAGGLGVAFGTGAANQTDITTDGGQLKDAVTAYYESPVALP